MKYFLENHPKWTQEPWVEAPKNVVEVAKRMAHQAHASIGQKRKYTNDPYIVHPAAVAKAVRENGGTNIMEAAAWLHDVLEDTPTTYASIVQKCGTKVAEMVLGCTDVGLDKRESRQERQEKNRWHVFRMSEKVQAIKKYDMLDNLPSIVQNDKNFARIWLEEKKLMIDVMTKLQEEERQSLSEVITNAIAFVEAEAVQSWLGKRSLIQR